MKPVSTAKAVAQLVHLVDIYFRQIPDHGVDPDILIPLSVRQAYLLSTVVLQR